MFCSNRCLQVEYLQHLGAEGRPHLHSIIPNSSSNKERRKQPRKGHFCSYSLWAVPGQWRCLRPVGCPVKWPGITYTLYLFSICLGSWRSQCWFGDFDNFISLSCVYLAFPIWLYGYDFREFQPFRVLKHKENCNIKSAELALPPLHSPCLRRAPNLLYLNIRFLDV